MNYFIIQFKNKNDTTESFQEMQLDRSADVTTFTSILNTLRRCDSEYFFYFQNQRILSTIKDLQSYEEILEVEFIDEKEFKANEVKECADTVISLSCYSSVGSSENGSNGQHAGDDNMPGNGSNAADGSIDENKAFYMSFDGNVYDFKNDFLLAKKMKGVFEKFAFDDFNIYNLIKSENELSLEITMEEEIKNCASFGNKIAIATEKRIFLFDSSVTSNPSDTSNLKVIKENVKDVRKIKISEDYICWIEGYNAIKVALTGGSTVHSIETHYSLNDIFISESCLFAVTANNKILIYSLLRFEDNPKEIDISRNFFGFSKEFSEFDIPMRFANFVSVFNNSILIATQSEIIVYSLVLSELNEKHFHKVNGQINAMISDGDRIYISHDNKISTFYKETLKL